MSSQEKQTSEADPLCHSEALGSHGPDLQSNPWLLAMLPDYKFEEF